MTQIWLKSHRKSSIQHGCMTLSGFTDLSIYCEIHCHKNIRDFPILELFGTEAHILFFSGKVDGLMTKFSVTAPSTEIQS